MLPLRDNVPTRAFPAVTVGIIAVNVIVWIWEFTGTSVQTDVIHYGYYPCKIDAPCVGPALQAQIPWYEEAFTSMFMHGGWEHIIFNMLFLWIFGNNVEEAMGRVKYLLFYLLAGIAALFAQVALSPDSTLPTLGASGAIAGVLGAYALLHPRARVLTLIFIIFFVTLVEIPAWIMLGIWFILQFVPAIGQVATPDVAGGGGVAYFAHVGGFLFGLAAVKLFTLGRAPPDEVP